MEMLVKRVTAFTLPLHKWSLVNGFRDRATQGHKVPATAEIGPRAELDGECT